MNYNDMLAFHLEKQAELTVAGVEVDRKLASAFGIIGSDDEFRIVDWEEKPKDPKPVPGKTDVSFVSMGVYIFNTETLVKNVIADAKNSASSHDFGKDVVPAMIGKNGVYVHNFKEANNEEGRYWRDIGTLDAYWSANMDLCEKDPPVNLYDPEWLIRTYQEQVPPARTVSSTEEVGSGLLNGTTLNSIISGGCIVSGTVSHSVLSPSVRLGSGSFVEDSVLLDHVTVGARAKIRKAIVDHEVQIPDDFVIGYDLAKDKERFTISPGGIVIVPRGISLG